MKRFYIILSFLTLAFTSQAQNYFNKLYPYGFGFGNTLVTDSFYYLVGQLYDDNNVSSNFISKIDILGNLLFVDTITEFPNSSAQGFLLKTNNGFAFSCVLNPTPNFLADSSNILFRRYDNFFNVLSETFIGGQKKDEINDIKGTPDGGYIITGITSSFNDSLNNDCYLVKLDSLGNLEWQNSYGFEGISDVGNSVAACSDGGYIMCGSTWVLPTPDVFGNYQTMITKVDSLGNQQWLKTYGTDYNDSGGGVDELPDQTYIVCTGFGSNTAQKIPIMLKLDLNGNIIWQRQYAGTNYSTLSDFVLKDGCITSRGITRNVQNTSVGWINKFDPNGNIIWQREYEVRSDIPQYIYDIKPTPDGGYLFCGSASDLDSIAFKSWLVKTDCLGCDSILCYYPDSICDVYDCSLFPIDANFTADDYIINLANEGEDTVTFTNAFGNTTNRVWDFGDGAVAYTDSVVQNAYTQTGTYEVQLIVYHGMCSDTLTQSVVVFDVAGLEEISSQTWVTIYPNPNKGAFSIESHYDKDLEIKLFDSQGKEVYQSSLKKGKNEFSLDLAPGMYILESGIQRERIVIH